MGHERLLIGLEMSLNRYQKRLENGVLAKARLDNTGIINLLYELEPQKNHKLALSAQLDATNLNKAPKLGAALDIKN